eukprot:490031_1
MKSTMNHIWPYSNPNGVLSMVQGYAHSNSLLVALVLIARSVIESHPTDLMASVSVGTVSSQQGRMYSEESARIYSIGWTLVISCIRQLDSPLSERFKSSLFHIVHQNLEIEGT